MGFKIGKICILVMAVTLFITCNALGGVGARNISTQSATAYLSGGGRYTETEDADTVLNNPAGAAFMEDGFHFHLSMMIAKTVWDIEKVNTGKVYETESLGVIPDLAATYKKNNWAGFFTISFPGGNGGGSYNEHPSFDFAAAQMSNVVNLSLKAENHEFDFAGGKGGLTIGGAYKVNDFFSVGYGIRAVYALNYVEGKTIFVSEETGQVIDEMRLNQSEDGWGLGHSFCFLFNFDKLKIGLRFDPEVDIETTKDVESDDTTRTEDGEKANDNLPPVLFSGASYQLTPKFKFGGGFIYYWQKGINGDDEPITDKWDNAYELQAFIEYALFPEWELITGVNYSNPGIPDEAYTLADTSFAKSYNFTIGTQYRPSDRWTFLIGTGYSYYPENPKTEADMMGIYERSPGTPPFMFYFGIEYKKLSDAST